MHELRVFIETVREELNPDHLRWGIGMMCAVITFIFELVLCQKGVVFSGKEKRLEKAKAAGNVVEGVRISCSYSDKDTGSRAVSRYYVAKYRYNLNGKIKNKVVGADSFEPPETLKLYYLDPNGKAFSEEYDMDPSPFEFLIYIIPVLVMMLVMVLSGFDVNTVR